MTAGKANPPPPTPSVEAPRVAASRPLQEAPSNTNAANKQAREWKALFLRAMGVTDPWAITSWTLARAEKEVERGCPGVAPSEAAISAVHLHVFGQRRESRKQMHERRRRIADGLREAATIQGKSRNDQPGAPSIPSDEKLLEAYVAGGNREMELNDAELSPKNVRAGVAAAMRGVLAGALVQERGAPDHDSSRWVCGVCGSRVDGPALAPLCPKGCQRMERTWIESMRADEEGRPLGERGAAPDRESYPSHDDGTPIYVASRPDVTLCPICGGEQFSNGSGSHRVSCPRRPLPVSAQQLAEMIAAYLACPNCADGEGAEVCAAHLEFFTEAFRA